VAEQQLGGIGNQPTVFGDVNRAIRTCVRMGADDDDRLILATLADAHPAMVEIGTCSISTASSTQTRRSAGYATTA
jgi:hypothetical protein